MISPKRIYQLAKKAVNGYLDDYAMSMGAAISYYTIFSIAPLLVLVIAIAGLVFGREAVQGLIVEQLGGLIGSEGASFVEGLVASASQTDRGIVAGLISIVVLLIGATTVFAELQSALDRIWHVPEAEKPSGIWAVLRARVLSFGLIMGLAFLLMVTLVVSAGLAAFGSWAGGLLPGGEVLLHGLQILVSGVVFTLLFAMIFKMMPTADIAWRDVWVGAIVTAVLFEVGKQLIGIYLGKSGFTETFAAAGALVILLAWVYYAVQIFLFGAEFTKAYADEHGSLAATRAQEGSRETRERGVPAEVPESAAPGNRQAAGAGSGLAPQAAKSGLGQEHVHTEVIVHGPIIAKLEQKKSKLMREAASLLVVSVAGVAVAEWRKRAQRRLSRG